MRPAHCQSTLARHRYAHGNPTTFRDPTGHFATLWPGTTSCEYYAEKCAEFGGTYYCDTAPTNCNRFPKPPRPGWSNCTRDCLQTCDQSQVSDRNACPATPDGRGFWSRDHFSCHVGCYLLCTMP